LLSERAGVSTDITVLNAAKFKALEHFYTAIIRHYKFDQ